MENASLDETIKIGEILQRQGKNISCVPIVLFTVNSAHLHYNEM